MRNLRTYGIHPYSIAVIHGGPGAPGEIAPVARELAKTGGVLEPLQTQLTIEGQVQELKTILEEHAELPIILVGHSWGAILSFVFTAENPAMVNKMILVSSGAFEDGYAANIMETRFSRLSAEEILEVDAILDSLNKHNGGNKNIILARFGELMAKADSYNQIPHQSEAIECQYEVNKSISAEAGKLRSSGQLLAYGKLITCPVSAIHGDYDSHLASGVKEPLSRVLKDFKFTMIKKCGHDPWYEQEARDAFYQILKKELT
jgi:pimeloyl-ACP methyl ester carboxylesterase